MEKQNLKKILELDTRSFESSFTTSQQWDPWTPILFEFQIQLWSLGVLVGIKGDHKHKAVGRVPDTEHTFIPRQQQWQVSQLKLLAMLDICPQQNTALAHSSISDRVCRGWCGQGRALRGKSEGQWMKEDNCHSTAQPVLSPTPSIQGGPLILELAARAQVSKVLSQGPLTLHSY